MATLAQLISMPRRPMRSSVMAATCASVRRTTLGGCGIWALIDLVRIITGDLKPKDGDYTTTL